MYAYDHVVIIPVTATLNIFGNTDEENSQSRCLETSAVQGENLFRVLADSLVVISCDCSFAIDHSSTIEGCWYSSLCLLFCLLLFPETRLGYQKLKVIITNSSSSSSYKFIG